MKLGPIEGTPEEIKNYFQNNNSNIFDFITRPEQPIKTIWFVVPTILVLCTLCALVFIIPSDVPWRTFNFIIGCGGGLWLSANIQLRYKNPWATGLIAIGCLLLLMVAFGIITPMQMLDEVKSFKK
jgi:hypothetical protein